MHNLKAMSKMKVHTALSILLCPVETSIPNIAFTLVYEHNKLRRIEEQTTGLET